MIDSRHLTLVAESTERMPFQGATPEQVAAVGKLMALNRFSAEHCRSVLMDGHGAWQDLAGAMRAAAKLCENQYVLAVELELQEQARRDEARRERNRRA